MGDALRRLDSVGRKIITVSFCRRRFAFRPFQRGFDAREQARDTMAEAPGEVDRVDCEGDPEMALRRSLDPPLLRRAAPSSGHSKRARLFFRRQRRPALPSERINQTRCFSTASLRMKCVLS
jgi:hypothetical protein